MKRVSAHGDNLRGVKVDFALILIYYQVGKYVLITNASTTTKNRSIQLEVKIQSHRINGHYIAYNRELEWIHDRNPMPSSQLGISFLIITS